MNRLARKGALLGALLISSVCTPCRADEPEPLHRYADDRLPPPSARINLMLSGAAMFGVSYGVAVGASYLWPEAHGASDLRIPVAGPWMKVGRTRLCKDDPEATNCQDAARIIGAVLAAVDGLAQAGGLLLIGQSIFMSTSPLTETSSSDFVSPLTFNLAQHLMAPARHAHGALPARNDFRLRAGVTSDAWMDAGFAIFGAF